MGVETSEEATASMQRTIAMGAKSSLQILLATILALFISATSTAAAQQLTTADIVDPANGLKAFTITIPAGWKFQGTVFPGPECAWSSYPVFRTYSSDGLTDIRLLPVFNWTFRPNLRMKAPNGCLEFGRALTATEFLNRYEEIIAANGMHVVGPMAIAPKVSPW